MLLKYKERRQKFTSIFFLKETVLNQLLMTYHYTNILRCFSVLIGETPNCRVDDQYRDSQLATVKKIRD